MISHRMKIVMLAVMMLTPACSESRPPPQAVTPAGAAAGSTLAPSIAGSSQMQHGPVAAPGITPDVTGSR